jgi:hypothetical protein
MTENCPGSLTYSGADTRKEALLMAPEYTLASVPAVQSDPLCRLDGEWL